MGNDRLIPTGDCWCGCGKEVNIGKFFAPGHDKKAEGDLLALEYEGSVARLLVANGYGPEGKSLHAAAIDKGLRKQCLYCDFTGNETSMTKHTLKEHVAE